MQLPKMEDVVARLEKEKETPLHERKIDLDALMYAALVHSINKRDQRLIRPKALRKGHLIFGRNPYKKRHTIARVKRAQYRNARAGRRVYVRSHQGGHF